MMKDRKAKAKLILLLGVIWIIVSLPLPWVINNPLVSESQFFTILGIIGIISIPFMPLIHLTNPFLLFLSVFYIVQ